MPHPGFPIEILKGIEIIGKALWIKSQKILVISDLHIGYEEALNKQGVLVPRTQFSEIKKELSDLIEKLKPKKIVINGDLKHEFGEISRQEWNDTLEILGLMLKNAEVVLVRGNHDRILGPIAEKRGLEIKEFYCLKDICIFHGDRIRLEKEANDSKILIIGHEHPAVLLREGNKTELYKCFLLGKWKGKRLIAMPSFFSLFEGKDITKEETLSPYLKDLGNSEVFIIGDKTYRFGKAKNIG